MNYASVHVTYKCNNKCKYCPLDYADKHKEPTITDIKKSIDKIRERGYDTIILSGGEPTLRKDIFEIIDYAKENGLNIHIKTNGRMFVYKKFAEKIAKSGVGKIILYFNSSDPEIFDEITQSKGSYFQSMNGIKNIIKNQMDLEVRIPVIRQNYNGFIELMILLKRLGVRNVKYLIMHPKGKDDKFFEDVFVNTHDAKKYVKKALEFSKKLNFDYVDAYLNKDNINSIKKSDKISEKDEEIHTYIQINTICNQKCVFCNRPPNNDYATHTVNKDEVKNKIDELSNDWKIKRLIFTGGEPLLNPDLNEIIRYANQHGFVTEIQTNGTLLTKTSLAALKAANLDIINFAFHSHKKEINDKLRCVEFGHEKIIENIKLANEMGFEVHIIHVINSLNYMDIPEFIDFINGMQIKDVYLNLSMVVPEGWAWKNKWIVPRMRDIKPYLTEAMKRCLKYKIKFDVSEIVPLCIVNGFEDHAISTLFRISNIKISDDYYTGKRVLDFMNPSDEYAAKAPQCKECTLNDICAGFYPRLKELYGVKDFVPRHDDPTLVVKRLNVNTDIMELFKNKKIEIAQHERERNPEILYINLDEKCNENCVFCVVKGNNEGKFGSMPNEEAKKLIRGFLKSEGKTIMFTGGEPTLRNDLPDIIEYSEQFDELQSISVITNGVRLSDKKYLKKMIKSDKKNKLSFCFSLHSHKRDLSELLTNSRGTFERTIKGIENVIDSERNLSVYQVITSKNYKDLLEFCKFLNSKYPQIRDVTFAYPFPQGNAVVNDWIYVKLSKLRPYIMAALNFLEANNYTINIAACGQFPLCVISGFEEKVLDALFFSEESIAGVVGERAFHEFEMASKKWTDQYKNKSNDCRKCILDKYCQGFWRKYTDLFKFDGLRPITEENFNGNKITSSLNDEADIRHVYDKLNKRKMNLLVLGDHDKIYLKNLIEIIVSERIFLTVVHNGKVIYP